VVVIDIMLISGGDVGKAEGRNILANGIHMLLIFLKYGVAGTSVLTLLWSKAGDFSLGTVYG
jgi:hypothetical protein